MAMKLTAAVAFVLVSISSVHASASAASIAVAGGGSGTCQPSGGNCNKITEVAGWPGLKRHPTTGDRSTTQERATGDSGRNSRKKATEFAGWWRGLKRHSTTGDSGRPTRSGENVYMAVYYNRRP